MIPILYKNDDNCCGCKACANVCPYDAISFRMDEFGFQYPIINEEKCIECEACIESCDFQKDAILGHQSLLGLAARHKKKYVYDNSTSGGMFTALAEWTFNKGGIVYGCAFDENMLPFHKSANNLEQLLCMRGSKYVQSDIGLIYRDVTSKLKEGKHVLFTGTPCQIAALYSVIGKNDIDKLITVDLICHGVPNSLVFRKYISYIENKYHKKIINFKFRDKRYGWERPVISVEFQDGRKKWWFTTVDVFYYNFSSRNLQRPSCFNCKYACSSRMGDITIGDFWGYQKANLQMKVKDGLSCLLVNTEKGKNIIKELNIEYLKVNPLIIIEGNTHLRTCSKKGNNWEEVLKNIKEYGFDNLYDTFRRTHLNTFLKAMVKRMVLKTRI